MLSVIVHDLRNPLNGMNLAVSFLDGLFSAESRPEVNECLALLGEGTRQLRSMLDVVAGYVSIQKRESEPVTSTTDPRALLAELIDEYESQSVLNRPLRLNWSWIRSPSSPITVRIDPSRVRLAFRLTLENCLAAVGGPEGSDQLRIESTLDDIRWRTRFVVNRPPGNELEPGPIPTWGSPRRLLGVPRERLGLDLVLAAGISASLGGTATVQIEPGRHSAVVLDWPVS